MIGRKALVSCIATLYMIAFVTRVHAATITATSCSLSDVQAAIDSASYGDTIHIPAGRCSWAATLVVTKGVNVIGAGSDSTFISCTSGSSIMRYLPADESSNTQFEVAGFSFNTNNRCTAIELGEYNYNPTIFQTKVKIHDNEFYGTTSSNSNFQYIMNYNMGGVIYKNIFTGRDQHIRSLGYGLTGIFGLVENTWGSGEALFIEDNIFTMNCNDGDYIADCQYAGVKRVWRYNTFNVDCDVSWSGFIDVHGYNDEEMTSCYGDEIYGNKGISSSNESWAWIAARGGKNAVFFNEVATSGAVSPGVYFSYGCPSTYQDAQNVRAYAWNNRKNVHILADGMTQQCGPECPFTCDGNSGFPKEDRQIFNYTTNFNGTGGVGCGSSLPDPSGYAERVGYFVTLQSCASVDGLVGDIMNNPDRGIISGTLYEVVNGVWVPIFTPHTYPHPLRAEGTVSGDLNSDGNVNVSDVQGCVNHILGGQDWGSAADVNGDGDVNVADVQMICNMILD